MPNTKSHLTGLHTPSLVFSFMYNKTTQKSEWFYFCSFITQSHFPKMFEHCIKQNKSKSYTFKLSLIHMYKDNIFNVKTDTFQKRKCSILNLSLGFAGPCFKFSFKILCHIPTFLEMGLFNIVKQDISPQNLKKAQKCARFLYHRLTVVMRQAFINIHDITCRYCVYTFTGQGTSNRSPVQCLKSVSLFMETYETKSVLNMTWDISGLLYTGERCRLHGDTLHRKRD